MKKLPKYLIYATLLDAFQGYLSSSEIYQKYWGFSEEPSKTEEQFEQEQFQSVIDRINRVPFDSEPADKGTAFNEVIDCIIENRASEKVEMKSNKENNTIWAKYNNREFVFPRNFCIEFAQQFKGAICQVHTSAILDTKYGPVELYGYIDELMPLKVHDIKTTGKYSVFDFKNHWQHRVYPFCLQQNGLDVSEFEYNVVEINKYNGSINNTYVEFYSYLPERDIPLLTSHIEALIEFIELNKHLITDKKIFNQHENNE